jgi:nucleoside 2-deoxyribosyltransferase
VIALLDGSQVDDGTAWEIGYFYAKKSAEQKIIGIRTDFHRAGERESGVVNPMIEVACDWVVSSREELMEVVSRLFQGEKSGETSGAVPSANELQRQGVKKG